MAFSKLYDTPAAAVSGIPDGATVLIGTSVNGDAPAGLLSALSNAGVRNLTCVLGPLGQSGSGSLIELIDSGAVGSIVSSGPFDGPCGDAVKSAWESRTLAVETVSAGALAERLRAGGAGIGGVFVPIGNGPRPADDSEIRTINGVECVLENPLNADFALIRAHRADAIGNLTYDGPQRGWNAVMATAARVTIVEADEVSEPGSLDPELVITPGIFVNRIVAVSNAGGR